MSARRVLVWAGLAVGVFMVGLVAGVVFGQAAPDVAARQIVREFAVSEPVTLDTVAEDAVAPTSGGNDGMAVCGRVPHLPVDDAIASLDAGLVVVHARTSDVADQAAAVLESSDPARWIVTVDDRVGDEVVATAWGVRMTLAAVDEHLLPAFVTGYAGRRGPLPECSPA